MPTINAENAKSIRTPFQVHCGLSKITDEDLTFVGTNYKAMGELQTDKDLINLDDLSGGGFPLDGSCVSYDPATMSEGIGMRSNAGAGMTLKVTCATIIPAITIRGRGIGEITDGTTTYEFRDGLVFPFNAKTKTFTITNDDPDDRIEIESVYPGVEFEIDNTNLISCVVSLRSDLTLVNPQWPASEIEINAYWPDDIITAISSMSDGTRIYYYSGYDDDRSETRYFYLSEKADVQKNVLTLKGQDASSKLDRDCAAETVYSEMRYAHRDMYNKMIKYITDAGIKLRKKESAPGAIGSTKTKNLLLFEQENARDLVASIMSLSHVNLTSIGGTYFWPVFVDAGIPSVRRTKPTSKWDIYEADCGDVVRSADRNIRTLKADDSTFGLVSSCSVGKKIKVETFGSCIKGRSTHKKVENDRYFANMTVTPGKVTSQTANEVTFIPGQFYKIVHEKHYRLSKRRYHGKRKKVSYYIKKKIKVSVGSVTLYGYPINNDISSQSKTYNRPGVTQPISVISHGKAIAGSSGNNMIVYPAYDCVFAQSNITGSFTWKGDPRMQPRDVFTFHRLNGVNEICTLETITLTHEGGGTSAAITYRLGVV